MISITDGDTIEVETSDGVITVRLAAINAPDREECFHSEARDLLVATLGDETVTLETVGTDQFDRLLAHVLIDERHLNDELVRDGLALAFSPGEEDPYREVILDAEEGAFSSGAGLWASTACGTQDPLPSIVIVPGASQPDPEGPDQDVLTSEIVVITNQGDHPADLSGWILRDESSRHRFTFAAGTIIDTGARLTVSSADRGWSPGGEPVWNNDGDMAILQDPAGTVVSRWRY